VVLLLPTWAVSELSPVLSPALFPAAELDDLLGLLLLVLLDALAATGTAGFLEEALLVVDGNGSAETTDSASSRSISSDASPLENLPAAWRWVRPNGCRASLKESKPLSAKSSANLLSCWTAAGGPDAWPKAMVTPVYTVILREGEARIL